MHVRLALHVSEDPTVGKDKERIRIMQKDLHLSTQCIDLFYVHVLSTVYICVKMLCSTVRYVRIH